MGMNDTAEMLEAAITENGRLERELAEAHRHRESAVAHAARRDLTLLQVMHILHPSWVRGRVMVRMVGAEDQARVRAIRALVEPADVGMLLDEMLPHHRVVADVIAERRRQDAKWGLNDHPDGAGPDAYPLEWQGPARFLNLDICSAYTLAVEFRERVQTRFRSNMADRPGTWTDILLEEVFEALAEDDPSRLRVRLVQTAAVLIAWAEAVDRRTAREEADRG